MIAEDEMRKSVDRTTDCRGLNMQIDQVRVIIYGLKDFYIGKKEKARPLYVVFGIGGTHYRTTTITSYDPKWSESQNFSITSEAVPLRITLREPTTNFGEDDIIWGKVVTDIRTFPEESDSQEQLAQLVPASRMESPRGYLRYECFITKYREKSEWACVEFLKQQIPRATDYINNFPWPSCSVLSKCCSKFRHRSEPVEPEQRESFVDKALARALIAQSTVDGDHIPGELIMFPFMTKSSVYKHVRAGKALGSSTPAVESPRKIKRWISRSEHDLPSRCSEPNLSGTKSIGEAFCVKPSMSARSKKMKRQRKLSRSCPDLSTHKIYRNRLKSVYQRAQRQTEIYEAIARKRKETIEASAPEVLSVDPDTSSVWGGTHLTIRGRFLGLDKLDITGLYVCGSSCLSSMQWDSPEQIRCVTKSWRACEGSVLVITSTGGRSVNTVKFQFVEEMKDRPKSNAVTFEELENNSDIQSETVSIDTTDYPSSYPTSSREGSFSKKPVGDMTKDYYRILNCVDEGTQTYESAMEIDQLENTYGTVSKRNSATVSVTLEELQDENKFLKGTVDTLQIEIAKLKRRNDELQAYVDNLVADVMLEAPEALSIKAYKDKNAKGNTVNVSKK